MRLPVILTLALAMGASACGTASAGRFDLDCHGTATKNGRTGPFKLVIHVDTSRGRFCFDDCDLLVNFSVISPNQLKLHYDIDAPGGVKPYGWVVAGKGPYAMSSGAPSQQKDDMLIDRTTGAFTRDDVYDQGDPASSRYVEHWTGVCRMAPATGNTG